MNKLFVLKNKKPVINDNLLLIPEFKELHDHLLTKDPSGEILGVALCQLYYLYDPESVYIYVEEDTREATIQKDFKHNDFNPNFDMAFLKAKAKAKELYVTPTQRLLLALKSSMDKISHYLMEEEITSGKDGNLSEIIRLHKESQFILKNFKSTEADFYKETSKNRGNTISAIDEDDTDDAF
jgi:hypothetical protein